MINRSWVSGGDSHHHFESTRADHLSAPGRDVAYRLTPTGHAELTDLGMQLDPPDRDGTLPLRYCVDWTEQRHHLSGAVGRALADRLFDLRWVHRLPRGRGVQLTPPGRSNLAQTLGVSL